MTGPWERMAEAARAAFDRPPDPDGIRRVPIVPKGLYQHPWFCLTEDDRWFLEERGPEGVVPELTTAPRPCPAAWRPR